MLTDPDLHWPFEWNPRRLVVQHMDALDLRYEDESFDGVFSGSSIEHFGGHAEAERSMDEMFRVLRPGGICAIATEFRLAGPSPGLPGCLLFARNPAARVRFQQAFEGGQVTKRYLVGGVEDYSPADTPRCP